MTSLAAFAADLAAGRIRVVDLTQTLSPDFPTIALPPQFGQCAPFRMEQISRYDAAGPAWYWNNITVGEHCGTHFDAPIHWISGKDLPNNAVDTIDPRNFIAPASVVDCSKESADPDFVVTVEFIEAWEKQHGRIEAGDWVLLRTDWSKKPFREYAGMGDDGAHTPGPAPATVKWLVEERVEVPVQINSKVRARVEIAVGADAAAHEAAARAEPRIAEMLNGATVRQVKVVPGKIVNFVLA